MRLDLECSVECSDDAFGELADVIIDPGTRRVTHLVVRPRDRHDLARLVPIGRARLDGPSRGAVSLDFTVHELGELERVHDSEFVRLDERLVEPGWDIGIHEISQMPLSGSLGVNALGAGMEPIGYDAHGTLSYDRIPAGTVELRGESDVTSSDGHHVGHVTGVVIDELERITELVVEHGHLWGKRELAIPVGSIDRIETDEVVLALSNDQVKR